MIDVAKIIPNPQQPRKRFDQEELESLAASMAWHKQTDYRIPCRDSDYQPYHIVEIELWSSIDARFILRPK